MSGTERHSESAHEAASDFDWADVAFASKKPLRELQATFIVAPRELSQKRFKEIVAQYLPKGNILLGISKEDYVLGFENQPQFRMLQQQTVQRVIDQVNKAATGRSIRILTYFQRELPYILEKIKFKHVALVNGSWQHVFHNSAAYYYLSSSRTPYDMISPFSNEDEARAYEHTINQANYEASLKKYGRLPMFEQDIMEVAVHVAKFSFDYSFQTGAVLAKQSAKQPGQYELITYSFNAVVPYQTYAMHNGSAREKNFSPANDLNYYDTNHAEVSLVLDAQKRKLDLHDTTLFINLMPCPTCARMLSQTDIKEFVYSIDHSDGYAVKMLEASGKKVRRIVL